MPLDNTQAELPPSTEKATLARRERYKLRAVAGRYLKHWRVSTCGNAMSDHIEIVRSEGKAHFLNVETCGSVWTCPVCAAKIAERRRVDIAEVCDRHTEQGGAVYMATFTIPHSRFDDLADLRAGVARAWQKMQAGAPWKRIKDEFGIVGTVRSLEVTHGDANGWHPHLHVLFFGGVHSASAIADRLYRRWASAAARAGVGGTSRAAFRFERAENAAAAADYTSKWGVDFEVAHGQAKKSTTGSTPWDLLRRASRGDKRAGKLFQVYAEAFKGARQLTWSRGIRDAYGIHDISDQDAAQIGGDVVEFATISGRVYREARWKGILPEVLEAAEQGGVLAVARLLRRHNIFVGRVDVERAIVDPPVDRAFNQDVDAVWKGLFDAG